MTLNLSKVIPEFLQKHSDEKFTSDALAKGIFKDYPKQCEEKRQRSKAKKVLLTDDKALIKQIAAEIPKFRSSLQKNHPKITTIEGRPRKYYYTEKTDIEEIEQIETFNASGSSPKLKEKDLYSKLSEFLHSEFNIYSYRINEKRSTNGRGPDGNKWLYPDIVGIEDLSADWNDEIKDCVTEYFDKKPNYHRMK